MIRAYLLVLAALSLSGCSHTPTATPLPLGVFQKKSALDASSALTPDYAHCSIATDEEASYEYWVELDLWDRIREGFALTDEFNKRIQIQLNWYSRHPSYIDRVSGRGQRYLFHVVEQLHQRGMPMEFALLPIVESAYDPFAYSHGRASGMWQVIPGTGKMLGLKQNWWYDGRRDVVASTDAALNYLQSLAKQFDGDWLLALAAYNSGAGNVQKAIRKNTRLGKPTDYWSLDLPRETLAYVPKLLALKTIVLNPELYGVNIPHLPNSATFAVVDVGSQLDLAQAAAMAGMEMKEFYLYNPGFNRWATDPDGPHRLLIPVEAETRFREALATLPTAERVTWERYQIRPGDTLSTIAARFKTSIALLQSINQIDGTNIRTGKTLLVPRASADSQHYILSASQRLLAKQNTGKGHKEKYLVKSGDSLWSIGKKMGVTSGQLAKWNGMAPKDTLRPGQSLVVWRPAKTSTAARSNTTRKVAYKVRKGDSLARIADKFDVHIADIVGWNKVNTARYLQPGELLTLYVDVTNIE